MALLGFFVFISGFTALLFEVSYNRLFSTVLGADVISSTIVLATFIGGMFLGARCAYCLLVKIRAAFPKANGLFVYALAEMVIGLCSLLILLAFPGLQSVGMVKYLWSILLLLLPSFFMGVTIPVLYDYAKDKEVVRQKTLAHLYGNNALGAAVGALATPYLFFPLFAIDGALKVGFLLNTLLALSALLLWKIEGEDESSEREEELEHSRIDIKINPYVFVFSCGFVSFVAEISIIRLFTSVLTSATFSFAIVVSSFIVGLALGGHWARGRSSEHVGCSLLWVCLASAFWALFILYAGREMPWLYVWMAGVFSRTAKGWVFFNALQLFAIFLVVSPLSFCWGAAFCLAAHLFPDGGTEKVAKLTAFNTLGNVLGATVGGFILLDFFGISRSLCLCSLLMLILAHNLGQGRRYVQVALGLLALFVMWQPPRYLQLDVVRRAIEDPTSMKSNPMETRRAFFDEVSSYEVHFYRESKYGVVSVLSPEAPLRVVEDERSLVINGKVDASNVGDVATQSLLGIVGQLFRNSSLEKVLVVGVGSGQSVAAALRFSPKSVDVAEINGDCYAASRLFSSVNGNYYDDVRCKLEVRDALSLVSGQKNQWDLIVLQPSNPWVSGVANLFTRDFFHELQEALTDDGLLVGWCHLYETTDESLLGILNSVKERFTATWVFRVPGSGDLIYIASHQTTSLPTIKQNYRRLVERIDHMEIKGLFPLRPALDCFIINELLSPNYWWVKGFGRKASYVDPYFEWTLPYRRWLHRGSHLFSTDFFPARCKPSGRLASHLFNEEELTSILERMVLAAPTMDLEPYAPSLLHRKSLIPHCKELKRMETEALFQLEQLERDEIIDSHWFERFLKSYRYILWFSLHLHGKRLQEPVERLLSLCQKHAQEASEEQWAKLLRTALWAGRTDVARKLLAIYEMSDEADCVAILDMVDNKKTYAELSKEQQELFQFIVPLSQ